MANGHAHHSRIRHILQWLAGIGQYRYIMGDISGRGRTLAAEPDKPIQRADKRIFAFRDISHGKQLIRFLRPIILPLAFFSLGSGGIMAENSVIRLPEPRLEDGAELPQLLAKRRSVREFSTTPLNRETVGQLLWSAQGITSEEGYRTAPSAGALYPLELYLVAGKVEGLETGCYRYAPRSHSLHRVAAGDLRSDLAKAALNQLWIEQAPASFVISAVYSRTTWKYGKRGIRYVQMEAGHAGQNLFLQAVAMGLGSVVVGAFDDDKLKKLLNLSIEAQPLSILPVGYPAGRNP
jgi:SagB-type dehydrogenase family enzyme